MINDRYVNYLDLIMPHCLHISKHDTVSNKCMQYDLSIKSINFPKNEIRCSCLMDLMWKIPENNT